LVQCSHPLSARSVERKAGGRPGSEVRSRQSEVRSQGIDFGLWTLDFALSLQLRDSAGLAPASPFGPDLPGSRAPTLLNYAIVRALYRRPARLVKKF
jgi:hypothetical protein